MIDHDAGCITCGDTARRMRVLEVDEPRELALCVDEQERRHRVDTGIVGAVAPGDTLLVHAGAALAREPA
jgi:hydrogenase maturation factor